MPKAPGTVGQFADMSRLLAKLWPAAASPLLAAMVSPAGTATTIGDEPVPPDVFGDVGSGTDPGDGFLWTALVVLKVAVLFLLAGLAEIGGGWLVWQAVRESRPWWWALIGSAVLVFYGFVPTLQPLSDFGRLYAVYGGIFIGLSYVWGVVFDGMRVDRGDLIGSLLSLAGVCVALFWPRGS